MQWCARVSRVCSLQFLQAVREVHHSCVDLEAAVGNGLTEQEASFGKTYGIRTTEPGLAIVALDLISATPWTRSHRVNSIALLFSLARASRLNLPPWHGLHHEGHEAGVAVRVQTLIYSAWSTICTNAHAELFVALGHGLSAAPQCTT